MAGAVVIDGVHFLPFTFTLVHFLTLCLRRFEMFHHDFDDFLFAQFCFHVTVLSARRLPDASAAPVVTMILQFHAASLRRLQFR